MGILLASNIGIEPLNRPKMDCDNFHADPRKKTMKLGDFLHELTNKHGDLLHDLLQPTRVLFIRI